MSLASAVLQRYRDSNKTSLYRNPASARRPSELEVHGRLHQHQLRHHLLQPLGSQHRDRGAGEIGDWFLLKNLQ